MTRTKKRRPHKKKAKAKSKKAHFWRLCPYGKHWVRKHPLKVPPSKKNPTGSVTTRRGHCARNPSGKDQLYPDEIHEIAAKSFSKAKNRPCPLELRFGKAGSKYDDLIAGWVQYWNEVLQPDVPLDPNLIKALIASESSFDPTILADRKNPRSARGLSQITDQTRKILSDEKGELRDHYITATREQMNDPSVNICSGVRWLFHKRELVSAKLGRPATWEEAVAEYKSISKGTKRDQELMKRFLKLVNDYKKCGK
jgi:hypothetical protein